MHVFLNVDKLKLQLMNLYIMLIRVILIDHNGFLKKVSYWIIHLYWLH